MIGNSWDEKLKPIFESNEFKQTCSFIENEYKTKTIYPAKKNIFNALKLTDYEKVKVIIVGQDPYHGENQAHGLSFSVQKDVKIPPSLRNIFKELYNDLNINIPVHGDLTKWAEEGVLLLNSVLTVEKNNPASHKNVGWELLTDYIIKVLNASSKPLVFILWGNFAKSKKSFITSSKHLIIESTHPSPFSAYNGFFNSKPFSKTNNFLSKNNIKEIEWKL